jgi:hypothetical protein
MGSQKIVRIHSKDKIKAQELACNKKDYDQEKKMNDELKEMKYMRTLHHIIGFPKQIK